MDEWTDKNQKSYKENLLRSVLKIFAFILVRYQIDMMIIICEFCSFTNRYGGQGGD